MAVSELKIRIKSGLAVFFGTVILFSFVLGLIRQLISLNRINRNLAKKQAELKRLEEENKYLQIKLEGGERSPVIEKENEEKTVTALKIANYQKWLKIFGY